MKCLVCSDDLTFASQASGFIAAAGYEPVVHGDAASLQSEALESVGMVLADLTLAGFDASTVAEHLLSQASGPLRLIAVGPHVHHAKLDAARQAGWTVYTRGQFHASADQILSE